MDSAFTGKVTLLEVVITSLVENLSPQAQSLLRATVPSLFRLLMTSVGDLHFGQFIFLFRFSSEIVLFHSAIFEEVFTGFADLFGVKWILPPYPAIIQTNITFRFFAVDFHDLPPRLRSIFFMAFDSIFSCIFSLQPFFIPQHDLPFDLVVVFFIIIFSLIFLLHLKQLLRLVSDS